jgi:hypothetical protein
MQMLGFLFARFPVQFAAMERSWEITPELCGTNWLRIVFGCAVLAFVSTAVEYFFKPRNEAYFGVVGALVIFVIDSFRTHSRLRYQLRLEDDCISAQYATGKLELIHKNDIAKLRETRAWDPRGHGLVVCSIGGFIRSRTTIFVPGALPDFELIRQTLTCWLNEPKLQQSIAISHNGIPYSTK